MMSSRLVVPRTTLASSSSFVADLSDEDVDDDVGEASRSASTAARVRINDDDGKVDMYRYWYTTNIHDLSRDTNVGFRVDDAGADGENNNDASPTATCSSCKKGLPVFFPILTASIILSVSASWYLIYPDQG